MSSNNKVVITADSTCDLPQNLVQENNITIIPLSILLGDKEYLDGVDIVPSDIYAHVGDTNELPKTAAVPPSRYQEVFADLVEQGNSVVHIGLSSAISSSYHNACVASEDMDGVFCVDSKSLCTAMGLLVLKACDYRDNGYSAERIAEEINALVPKLSTTFVLDNLEYLHKGGRCSSVARFGANVLGIKPSIVVNNADGTMDVGKKYRGKMDAVYKQYVSDCLKDIDDIDTQRVVIANSGGIDSSVIDSTKDLVESRASFDQVIFADAGCTISSHCGPKTLAIFYIRK